MRTLDKTGRQAGRKEGKKESGKSRTGEFGEVGCWLLGSDNISWFFWCCALVVLVEAMVVDVVIVGGDGERDDVRNNDSWR